jgi:DNA-binding HxlR family transcriptional regulator
MDKYKLNGTFFYCPVDLTLHVVGGRWKGLVLWNLRNGALRYGEIKKTLVTINDKMLAQVLRDLEENGIIDRKVYEVVPPKVEYSLTKEGKKLMPIMQAMSEWGTEYKAK